MRLEMHLNPVQFAALLQIKEQYKSKTTGQRRFVNGNSLRKELDRIYLAVDTAIKSCSKHIIH